mgnify:CR=1 FL=1
MAKTLECRVCSLRLLDSSAEETVRDQNFGGSDVRIEGPHYRQLGLQTNTKEACKCEGRFRLLNLHSSSIPTSVRLVLDFNDSICPIQLPDSGEI